LEEEEMKRLFSLFSLVMVAMMLVTACSPAAPKKIRVVTDATWPPFEILDEKTKDIQGLDIDIMKAIAADQGLDVEIINVPFDSALAGLSQCQYDAGISSITITDERKKQMAFSDPYFIAGQIITVNAANTSINSVDDLKGKKVGAQIGTTGAIEANKVSGVQFTGYDTIDPAFLAVMTNQIDAVIADNPLAIGYVAKNSAKLKTVGKVFTDENYGIAVCPKNTELLAKINKGLADIKAAGKIDEITKTWMSK
jgi:polar amino acid transport system substrate-binding protein